MTCKSLSVLPTPCVIAQVLADFWWAHLVPAKHALAAGDWELVDTFRPDPGHAATKPLKEASQRMVAMAPRRSFGPSLPDM